MWKRFRNKLTAEWTDRRVRRAHRDWPTYLYFAVRTAHPTVMFPFSHQSDGDYDCIGTVRFYRSHWLYCQIKSRHLYI